MQFLHSSHQQVVSILQETHERDLQPKRVRRHAGVRLKGHSTPGEKPDCGQQQSRVRVLLPWNAQADVETNGTPLEVPLFVEKQEDLVL